ncbi:MAG: hypothetical protein ABI488_27200 [Polyangiaceae bacterium]
MRALAIGRQKLGLALFALALGCGKTSNAGAPPGDGGSPNAGAPSGDGGSPNSEQGGTAAGGSPSSPSGGVASAASAGRNSMAVGGSSGVAGSGQVMLGGSPAGGAAGAAAAPYKLCRGDRPVLSRDQYLALVAEECTEIMGALTISQDSDLSDLPALKTLTLVGRQMTISHNPLLTALPGFPALESVGDVLTVDDNPALTSLALPKLRSARVFSIAGSPLHDLSGLGALEMVPDGFTLSGPIEALTGLNLASVGYLDISLPRLKSLSGLEALRQVDRLSLAEALVSDLTGLHDLAVRAFTLSDCPNLTSLQGLGSGVVVQEWNLYNNGHMTSLNGLPLAGLKGLSIQGLDQLSSLVALTEVESLSYLGLLRLPALSNLHGLERLHDVSGDLSFQSLPQLSALSELSALRTVDSLTLSSLAKLKDLGGLSSLTHAYHGLFLNDNSVLSSLAPFLSWPNGVVEGSMQIRDNPLLPQCQADQLASTQASAFGCALCDGNLPGACP